MKKILFGALVLLSIFTISLNADPIVNEVTLDPASPSPKSTITFTADVTGDQIEEVYLIAQECNEELCFQKVNKSMTKLESGNYQAKMTLSKSSATYIQYWVEINDGGTWYGSDDDLIKKDLSTEEDNSSPGFELFVLLFSIIILIFIIKKKRR